MHIEQKRKTKVKSKVCDACVTTDFAQPIMDLGVVSASFVYGYRIDQESEIGGHFMLHAS